MNEIRLIARVPTVADLPATANPIDVFAVTEGRQFAGWLPPESGRTGWELDLWDAPGCARDYFGVELEDVPLYQEQ